MDDTQFGRYRLRDLIGEGGMGKVYKAYDTTIDRDVAVKVLPAALADDPAYRQRFRREAHTAARLTEPHIIPVYDTGEIDGHLYLVMPIINGTDLGTLLKRNGAMPADLAVRVITQLAAALDAAHANGLVHRDIKPSNALMTGGEFVYLIDFGIAQDATSTKLTKTGMVVGTMAYMAPERLTTGTADARADVYALACVLYECLTGNQPYPGDSMEQQITGHLQLDPPRPTQHRPGTPPGFDNVIARGMAKDPNQRYQTAGELAAAAQAALTTPAPGPPGPPAHPSTPGQIQTPPTTPPRTAWAPPSQPAPLNPPDAPRRSRTPWVIAAAAAATAMLITAVVVIFIATSNGPTTTPTAQPTATSSAQATTDTQTTSAAPTSTSAPNRTDSLLLTPQEIDAAMGVTGMAPLHTARSAWSAETTLSNPDCLESLYGGMEKTYASSGYTAISVEDLTEEDTPVNYVAQAAAKFSSVDQLMAFMKNSAGKMKSCAGQKVTEKQGEQVSLQWTIGDLVGTIPMITQQNTLQNGKVCQRALRGVSNLILDVTVCGRNLHDQARQITDQMAAKVHP